MVDQITSKQEGFGYFNVEPGKVWLTIQILILMKRYVCVLGMSVALVVNNLGGTSNLELLLVMKEAISYLGQWVEFSIVLGNNILTVWVGSIFCCLFVCLFQQLVILLSLTVIIELC